LSRYLRKVVGLIVTGLQNLARPELITLGIHGWQPPPQPAIASLELPVILTVTTVEPPGLTKLYDILRQF
jgi:hypothetical protein